MLCCRDISQQSSARRSRAAVVRTAEQWEILIYVSLRRSEEFKKRAAIIRRDHKMIGVIHRIQFRVSRRRRKLLHLLACYYLQIMFNVHRTCDAVSYQSVDA